MCTVKRPTRKSHYDCTHCRVRKTSTRNTQNLFHLLSVFYLGLAYLLSGCLFVAPAEKGKFTESLTTVSVVVFIFVPVCD